MRISDCSSDVCSSDLLDDAATVAQRRAGVSEFGFLRVLVPAAQNRTTDIDERFEHDVLLYAAEEVLGGRTPPLRHLNAEQPSEMVMEAVGASAIGDVQRHLQRLRDREGDPRTACLIIQGAKGVEPFAECGQSCPADRTSTRLNSS